MPRLLRVVPNEQFQLILELADEGFRVFDGAVARKEKGWGNFLYPQIIKNPSLSEDGVAWPGSRSLDAACLMSASQPIAPPALKNQVLRMGYRNQAPTPQHLSHHVFGVNLDPFARQPFELEESIGGGHAEMGGAMRYSLAELRHYREALLLQRAPRAMR